MICKLTVKMLPEMAQIMHDGQRMKLDKDEVRGVLGGVSKLSRLQILHKIDFSSHGVLFHATQHPNTVRQDLWRKQHACLNESCQKFVSNMAVSNEEATGCPGLWSIPSGRHQ